MRRAEIRWVDLAPTRGAEACTVRPAVFVNNGGANVTAERLGRGVATVVPVTTNVSKVFPFRFCSRPRSLA